MKKQLTPEQQKRLADYLEVLKSLPEADAGQLTQIAQNICNYTDDPAPALLAIAEHPQADADTLRAVHSQIPNCSIIGQTFVVAEIKLRAPGQIIHMNFDAS